MPGQLSTSTRRRIAARAANSFSGSVRSKTPRSHSAELKETCVEGARSRPAERLSEHRRAPDRSEQRPELPPELPPTRTSSISSFTDSMRSTAARIVSAPRVIRSHLALVRARIALEREPPGDRIEVDSLCQRARADRCGGLLHHRQQRLLRAPARLKKRRKVAALTQLRDPLPLDGRPLGEGRTRPAARPHRG